MNNMEVSDLVARACAGDASAWDRIVDEYANLVWSVARAFRLSDAHAFDAVQATWLALLEHLDQVRDPERLPGWLKVTARNMCIKVLKTRNKEFLIDVQDVRNLSADAFVFGSDTSDLPEVEVARREQVALVRLALAELPERQRLLVTLLFTSPAISYEEISQRVWMPVGSIGPTRARILAKLRALLETAGMEDAQLV